MMFERVREMIFSAVSGIFLRPSFTQLLAIPSTHTRTSRTHRVIVFFIVFSFLFGDLQTIYLGVPRAFADTTATLTATANAAKAASAGDNNGFETTPTNTTSNNAAYAVDASSGTGAATDGCATFNQAEDDAHDFYNFGITTIPTGARIDGITVDTDSKWDSNVGVNQLCVELSWNAGTSWTATAYTTGDIGTADTAVALGGVANTWGRTWTVSELADANFRLRVMIDPGASSARTASLDYLAVTVTYSPSVSVSGTIYSDEGTTANTSGGKALVMRVGTSTPGFFATTTLSTTGFYQFNNLYNIQLGTPIALWVDNDATFRAYSFTKASSTTNNITNFDLYKNVIRVKHEGILSSTGTTTSNAELGLYDGDDDTDIQFTSNSNNLVTNAGQKLLVAYGTNYVPGGTITTHSSSTAASPSGDFQLEYRNSTSSMLTLGGTLSVSGSYYASTSAIMNTNGYGVLFTATTTGKQIQGELTGAAAFASTTFAGTNGGWTFGSNASTSGNFLITSGAVTAPSGTLTIGGNYQNSGTFTNNGGTTYLSGLGTTYSGTMTGSSAFNHVVVGGAVGDGYTSYSPGGSLYAIIIDTANSVLYAGSSGGIVYRCLLSTSCDAVGDWTISYDSPELFVYSLTIDTTNSVLYAGTGNAGVIYRCPLSTSCDAALDWTTSYDTTEFYIYSLTIDTANSVLYAGTGSGGIIYRCLLSTACDAAGDWTTSYDTPELFIYSLTVDSANSVLYAGTGSGGIIYRCLLSTACDAAGDWTTSYDTPESTIYSLTIDTVNSVLYAGTWGGGIIYRCLLSTACDAAGDWTTSYDTPVASINSLAVDSVYSILYAGSGNTGFIYRCLLSTACDAAGDWTTSYDTPDTYIYAFTIDTTNSVLYAGTGDGFIYRRGNSSTFEGNASTTNLTINSGTTSATALLSIAGNYTNSGTFTHNGTVYASSSGAQTFSGTAIGTSAFNNIIFSGAGTKSFFSGSSASTSDFTIGASSGAVTAPSLLTITGNYANSGTFTHNGGTLYFATPPFGDGGSGMMTYDSGAGQGDVANAIAVDSSGNIYVAGYRWTESNGNDFAIRKYNANGVLCDGLGACAAWGEGSTGMVTYNSGALLTDTATAIAVDSSNNIYVAGYQNSAANGYDFAIRKYNANGVLCDGLGACSAWGSGSTGMVTYNSGAAQADMAYAIAVDSSNNIYVAGAEETNGGDLVIRKYNANGVLCDGLGACAAWGSGSTGMVTYDSGAAQADVAYAITIDSSSNIYVAGHQGTNGGDFAIRKYNANGVLCDGLGACAAWGEGSTGMVTYNSGASQADYARAITIDASGNIYVAGYQGTNGNDFVIRKYNANGVLCDGLGACAAWGSGSTGMVTYNSGASQADLAYAITIDSSKNIYVAGYQMTSVANGADFAVRKYSANGVLCDTGTACLSVTTNISGNITGSSAFGNTYIMGNKQFLSNASTTNLTINSGASSSAPSLLSIGGNYTNSGSFTHNSGLVYLNGSAQQILTGNMIGDNAFNNLTILNNYGTNAQTNPGIIFANTSSTTGTFTATVASTSIRFPASATTSMTNIILTGTSATAPVFLRSSVADTAAGISVSGTRSLTFVDVKDLNACSGYANLSVTSGTNSGNNSCWDFVVLENLIISGTLYSDEGVTAYAGGGKTLRLRIGTSTPGFFGTTTLSGTGFYRFPVTSIVSGIPLSLWVDGDSSFPAYSFTKASSTTNNITNFDLYKNVIRVKHEGILSSTGTTTSNAELGLYDGDDDTDIQFTSNSNNLVTNAGQKLLVAYGTNYVPGGTITTHSSSTAASPSGDFQLEYRNSTSSMITLGGTLSVSGSYYASTSAIMNTNGYGVLFTATTTGKQIQGDLTGVAALGSATFSGVGGAWTFGNNASTTGDFTITNGSVTAPSLLTIGGHYSNSINGGTFAHNNGSIYFSTSSTQTISGNATSSPFYNMIVTGGGTTTFIGTTQASTTDLTINANGIFVAPGLISVNGNFTQNGSLNASASSSTFFFAGTSAQTIAGSFIASSSFAALTFSGAGTKTFSNNASTSDFIIGASSGAVTAPSLLTIIGNYANSGTFTAGSNTVYFSTTSTQTISGTAVGTSAFYNFMKINTGTTTFSSNASTTNLTISSGTTSAPALLSIAGNYTNSGGFTHNSGLVYLNGSAQQTFSGNMTGSNAFNDLTILNNYGTNAQTNPGIIFANTSSTTGTFTATVASTSIRFPASATTSMTNIILTGTSATAPIFLRSSTPDTYAGLSVSGTRSVTHADVKDSGACSGYSNITAVSSTNGGNNICWDFLLNLIVSGRIYTDEGTTDLTTAGKTLMLRVGTSTAGFFATSTIAANGFWQVQNILPIGIYSGMPVSAWIDNDPTFRAYSFTKASSTTNSITGLDLYKNYVIVKHEGFTGTSTTNADLGVYDADDDSDIQFRANSPLNINATTSLFVAPGTMFAPGGDIIIHGNGLAASDGNLRLATGNRQDGTATTSILTMGANTLRLAGNWFASSTSVFTHLSTVFMNSTSSATKLIVATSSPFRDLFFNGSSGASWSFGANAATTTLDFTIATGTVTAASTGISIGRNFSNTGTFSNNGGTMTFVAPTSTLASTLATYITGRDSDGSAAGTTGPAIRSIAISGNYAFVGKDANGTACSQSVGSARGCEFQVFDISTPTNPVYVAGRDSDGSAAGTLGTAIYSVSVSGNYAYVGKDFDSTACSQSAGSADGCEFMVFDISTPTDPVYVAGRDSDGSAAGTLGTTINSVTISGNYAYVGKIGSATACSQTAGSAIGCEFMVFDVSSPTNPVYIAGRDSDGSAAGTLGPSINAIVVSGNYAYVGKDFDFTACSQSAGSADGCEFMVFDISTPTNPVYVAGRDASGSSTGTGSANTRSVAVSGNYAYFGKTGSATSCSQTAGSAIGCEFMVFDVSSPTNPVYVAGRDATGDSTGAGNGNIRPVVISGNYAYVGKENNATACSQTAGSAAGCELMVFDVSTPTDPVYVAGRDSDGSATGTLGPIIYSIAISGNYAFVGKNSDITACSQTAGSADGCELMVFSSPNLLLGNMTGSSAFNHVQLSGAGPVAFMNNASTTDLTINANDIFVAPGLISVNGNYTNNGTFKHNGGTVFFSTTTYGWDVSKASATSTGFKSIVTEDPNTNGDLTFSYDGMTMYVVGPSNNTVYQYSLTTPWDVSTASYASLSKSVDAQDFTSRAVTFSPDGTKMYVVGDNNNTIYQYSLTIPWNVSTASASSTDFRSVTAQETSPNGVTFSPDGLKMYVVGFSNDTVYQYSLTIPWNVSTASASSTDFKSVAAQDTSPEGISFSPDGTTMYIMGLFTDTVYQYTLSTPWDVSTASYASLSKSVTAQDTSPRGVAFSPDGTKMYVLGDTNNTVYQYSIAGGLSVSGNLTGSSAFNNVNIVSGGVSFQSNASTTGNFTVGSLAATTTINNLLTIGGNLSNSGYFNTNFGTLYFSTTTGTQMLSGTLTGDSALPSVQFLGAGTKTFSNNASTTNHFVIDSTSGAVTAPSFLSISGNYTNSGTFTHNSGLVYLNGSAQQTLTGNMIGSNAFNDLTILNNYGTNAQTNPGIIFANTSSTTGTFTATVASTSIRFPASATTSIGNLVLTGTSAVDPVFLRSSTPDTYAGLSVSGTRSVTYADVKDSGACSGYANIDTVNSTDSGNNICWSFPGGGTPALTFLHYRWRMDHESEVSAGYYKAEDTALLNQLYKGDRLRLRTTIENTGTGPATDYDFRLEYASSSCTAWSTLGTSAEWYPDLTQYALDGSATTDAGGLSNPDGLTFQPGVFRSAAANTGAYTLPANYFTEHEFSIASTRYSTYGLTYCFRITNAGSVTNFTNAVQPQFYYRGDVRPHSGGSSIEVNGVGPIIGGGGQGGGTGAEESGSGGSRGGGSAGGGGDSG